MIDIYFTLSQAEYLEAQKLYMSKNRILKVLRWGALIVAVIGAGVVLFRSQNGFDIDTFRQFAPFFMFALILFASPLLQRSGFKKRYLKEKQNFTNAHLIIDEIGYHLDVPGIGGGVAEWGGLDCWLEGKGVFALRSGLIMRIIPKTPLSESEIEGARNLLTEKLGPVGVMRKR